MAVALLGTVCRESTQRKIPQCTVCMYLIPVGYKCKVKWGKLWDLISMNTTATPYEDSYKARWGNLGKTCILPTSSTEKLSPLSKLPILHT